MGAVSLKLLTDADRDWFRERGFTGHNSVSCMKTATRSEERRYIQIRNGGWRAMRENPFFRSLLWVSDPFPDPISCYINAELQQWQS